MNRTGFCHRRTLVMSATVLIVLCLLALSGAPGVLAQTPSTPPAPAPQAAPAQPAAHGGGEASLKLPDLGQANFVGVNGRTLLMAGPGHLRAGPRLRARHLHPAQGAARAPVHARDLGAHLRDLQDLPDQPGQVPPHPRGLHRHHHGLLLRRAPALRGDQGRDHPALQPDRHRRQLRRRVVRHPDQHLRQLPHRLREPRGQAVPRLRHPAQGRA